MIRPAITFGEPLAGEASERLRRRVAAWAEWYARTPLHVDTVLGMWKGLVAAEAHALTATYLLFDLHRVFLYREPAEPEAPQIGSVVRFIVDGYPFQPFDRIADHLAGKPHPFLYAPEVLDILPLLWWALPPGTLATLDLTTGEITRALAHVHPQAHPVRWVPAGAARPPASRMELCERPTDASLRAGRLPKLEGLLSPVAGPVRELAAVANHASLPFATTRVMWNCGKQKEFTGGKSVRAGDAGLVAVCEALERFQVAFQLPGEELVLGSYGELHEHAVDPRALFFEPFSPPPGMPIFTDDAPLYWTWAFDPAGGPQALVPAQEVWFTTSRVLGEPYYIEPTTSGIALGGSVEEAALFALFEAVERDAYLTMWYLRRRCVRIDPASVRYEPFQLLRRRWYAAYPDYALFFFDIGTDIAVPTVAAIAVRERGEGPRTFHAAAARLSAERACFTALKDLTGFTPQLAPGRIDEMRRLLDEPERIVGPASHFELYALDETFERLGFMDFGPEAPLDVRELDARAFIPSAERYELRGVIERLVEQMRPLGIPIYLKDITHPSLAPRGLRCVKAVTPGLYPIWFGSRVKRFSVTDRLRRLARDLVGQPLSDPQDFNLEVHPFS